MANERKQKFTPKGIDPETGEAYEAVKREGWDKLLKRVAKPRAG